MYTNFAAIRKISCTVIQIPSGIFKDLLFTTINTSCNQHRAVSVQLSVQPTGDWIGEVQSHPMMPHKISQVDYEVSVFIRGAKRHAIGGS
jgi:hypothetical protein